MYIYIYISDHRSYLTRCLEYTISLRFGCSLKLTTSNNCRFPLRLVFPNKPTRVPQDCGHPDVSFQMTPPSFFSSGQRCRVTLFVWVDHHWFPSPKRVPICLHPQKTESLEDVRLAQLRNYALQLRDAMSKGIPGFYPKMVIDTGRNGNSVAAADKSQPTFGQFFFRDEGPHPFTVCI